MSNNIGLLIFFGIIIRSVFPYMAFDSRSIIQVGEFSSNSDSQQSEPDCNALPLLVTRDLVLFPEVVCPIMLTRSQAQTVAEWADDHHEQVGVICQKDPDRENPASVTDDLFEYGCFATVVKVIKLPDDSLTALVKAHGRFRVEGPAEGPLQGVLYARVKPVKDRKNSEKDKEFAALAQRIRKITTALVTRGQNASEPNEMLMNMEQTHDMADLVHVVATHSPIPPQLKAEMLSLLSAKERAFMLLTELSKAEQFARMMDDIQDRTRRQIGEHQREAFLRNQMDVIRDEIYGGQDPEIKELEDAAKKAKMPKEAKKAFDKELEKLGRLAPQSPDYSTQYTYLQTLLALPWSKETKPQNDFNAANEILERDHYGLEKVKERILEQIAEVINRPDGHAPILCLVGAPGVGKTSLGRSLAEALGRKYQRVSLGGLHDEAEIRGHRRTYIGALPGRIIDALKRAESKNPLLLLDEIDKIGSDFKGDPSAALLEVLDPEQNVRFHDNYVDIDFDLSHTMFVATANTLQGIPAPLIDRMEVIEIPGYVAEEKLQIARRHLIPRILEALNIEAEQLEIPDDTIAKVIERYTAESGVRQLEQQLRSLARKWLVKKLRTKKAEKTITPELAVEMLGLERYSDERYSYTGLPGVATGLAWTAVGGKILFIETSLAPGGKGEKLTLTGNLGDVMKESAVIALQHLRANADAYGIDPAKLTDRILHIHVPEGAIPKDGPSAGITMATAILSALTWRPVAKGVAMTGEITLSGKVLPVGGIKEKVLAAKRAGMTRIIMCEENRRDILDIKPEYLDGLSFHYVKTYAEVAAQALAE